MTKLTGSGIQGKFSKLTTTQSKTGRGPIGKILPSTKCCNPNCRLDGFIKTGQVRVTQNGNSYHFKCEPKKQT